ncbi:hypothetical protein PNOK_0280100 [Pyrrhoderma noxium]|uniref:Uncharacterized protein n=1 Tax=Pyrrhoderma noxium TaxID=2282107 RepID=A0A286UTH3_9AGAM|nr:hypothetical protein PNOK_0280100 [Pyrrhoderma noxium]
MPPSQSQSPISYDRDRTPITSPSERFRAIYDATQVSPPSVPASISVSPRPTRSASLNYSKINSSSSMGMGRRRAPSPPLPPLPPLQSPTSSHSHPHPVRSNSVGGPGIRSPQRVVRPTIIPSSSSSSSSSGMRQQKQQSANKMPPPASGPRMAIPSLRAKLGAIGKIRKLAKSDRDASVKKNASQQSVNEQRYSGDKRSQNLEGARVSGSSSSNVDSRRGRGATTPSRSEHSNIEDDWSYVDVRMNSPSASSALAPSDLAEWKMDVNTGQRILVYKNTQESQYSTRPSRPTHTAASASVTYESHSSSSNYSSSRTYYDEQDSGRPRTKPLESFDRVREQRQEYSGIDNSIRATTERSYAKSPIPPSESTYPSSSPRYTPPSTRMEQRSNYSHTTDSSPYVPARTTERRQTDTILDRSLTQSPTYTPYIEPSVPASSPYTHSTRRRETSQPPTRSRTNLESVQERYVHRRTGTETTTRVELPSQSSSGRMGRYGVYASSSATPSPSMSSPDINNVSNYVERGRSESVRPHQQSVDRNLVPRSTAKQVIPGSFEVSTESESGVSTPGSSQREQLPLSALDRNKGNVPALVKQQTRKETPLTQYMNQVSNREPVKKSIQRPGIENNSQESVPSRVEKQVEKEDAVSQLRPRGVDLHAGAASVDSNSHPLVNEDTQTTPKLQSSLAFNSISGIGPALAAAFASASTTLAEIEAIKDGQVNKSSDNATSDENKDKTKAGANPVNSAESPSSSGANALHISLLRGTEAMWGKLFGGSSSKGKEPATSNNPTDSNPKSATSDPDSGSDTETEGEIQGSRDVMLYSPLIPSATSLVEVAQSEIVTLYSDGEGGNNPYGSVQREMAYRAELRRRWEDGRGFISFDSLSTFESLQEENEEEEKSDLGRGREVRGKEGIARNQSPLVESFNAGSKSQARLGTQGVAGTTEKSSPEGEKKEKSEANGENKKGKKAKERIVWKPSDTQLSLQVCWWGYRIYLPPPVLEVLNSRSLEAAKRTALISSALTWMVENIPLSLLPPPLAPAALLLKGLIPVVGAIGTFIAWSWKAIVMFDRGRGVVLSASWVMPIVLAPSAWDEVGEEGERMPDGLGLGNRGNGGVQQAVGRGVENENEDKNEAGPSGSR